MSCLTSLNDVVASPESSSSVSWTGWPLIPPCALVHFTQAFAAFMNSGSPNGPLAAMIDPTFMGAVALPLPVLELAELPDEPDEQAAVSSTAAPISAASEHAPLLRCARTLLRRPIGHPLA